MSFVTLSEVKAVGRIDYDTHDLQLQMLIDAAEEFVEEHCCIALTERTITGERMDGGACQLWPKVLPVTSVDSVEDTWLDETIDTGDYFATDTRIVYEEEGVWLPGELRYSVTYDAGYTVSTAPKGLKPAIIGLVLLGYNNSEGKASQAANGFGCNFRQLASDNDLINRLDHFSLRRYVE